MYKLLILSLLLLNVGAALPQEKGSLCLEIENIEKAGGMIWVGIYDSERSFMVKELATLVQGEQVRNEKRLIMYLEEIPYGTYALALFHDENNNGTLDQNVIGIPVEPYAFSAEPVSKWRKPRFEEMKFNFTRAGQKIKTQLERWSF